MKIMESKLFLFFTFLLIVQLSYSQVARTQLLQNWTVEIQSGHQKVNSFKGKKFNTSIPTTIHLDLFSNGLIPDPFLKNNYQSLRWVSQSLVLYETTFTMDANILKNKNHRIVFEGIDTYSMILLNGQKILTTQNAFRQYSAIVNSLLKPGENKLLVQIKPTKQFDAQGQRTNSMPFQYAHTRKACYQYSWDWAPYLNTIGIWKKVYIESFNDLQINYVWARNRFISEKKAIINFAVALDIPQLIEEKYYIAVKYQGKVLSSTPLKQKNSYIDVEIQEPRLWWPNGIGESFIYDFSVEIISNNNLTIDSRKIPYGIRSVKVDQTDKKFTVIVNGYPVYAKGANYVPPDMFYPRLTNPKYARVNTIKQLLEDAVDSHFNMIRLWGGGQYESDQFFQLASRKGIMIFYDFMFSDSIYPATQNFLINVEEQIKQQIRRVRNYPCLALWSGNNEILQGINDWGWSRQNYRDNYKTLFETLIPKIIEIQNPDISYIPSSPVFGVGNYGFNRGGDVHYWGVWAGGSPFESYKQSVGAFNSEFGTQALPVWETICQTVEEKDRNYESPILLSHERHNSRFGMLKGYMSQYMKQSLNFELEAYQSGLLQAHAIEIAIKYQRASKPKTSWGTLYWQFNDAWPAISWSSIDYFGRWKPLQFMAKRLYPDIAIFYTDHGIIAVNDKLYPVQALAIIQLVTFDGVYLVNQTQKVHLQANEVKTLTVDLQKVKGNEDKSVLYTQIVGGRKQTMSSTHFFKRFKQIELPNGQLKVTYNKKYKEITLQSATVLKNVFISSKTQYLKLSDNYFDLIPGHQVKVVILNEGQVEKIFDTLVYRSYRQVYIQEKLKVTILNNQV